MQKKQILVSNGEHDFSWSLVGMIAITSVLVLTGLFLFRVKLVSALPCDANAVGTNVMIGCVWEDVNFDGNVDAGDNLIGPARQNPPNTMNGPAHLRNYAALGWWNFSHHHWGCCYGDPNLGEVPNGCLANSCSLVGSHPLAVAGVPGWGEQNRIPKSIGIWKGNFTFDNAMYVFYLSGDFDHPRKLFIDNALVGNNNAVFLTRQMVPGTHNVRVEYSQKPPGGWYAEDASLDLNIEMMEPTFNISPATTSITAGQTATFTASYDPDGTIDFGYPHYVSLPAQDVTMTSDWTSSNSAIATITGKGQVQGIAAGTVTITARYPLPNTFWTSNNGIETFDGIRDTSTITVLATPAVPVVTTPTATSITSTSATLGATVSSLGIPATISARGVCYGTMASPSLINGATCITATLAQTLTAYTISATSLTPNTAYNYRGYATNATGTGYSADGVTFTTNTLAFPDLTAAASSPSTATVNMPQTYTSVISNIGTATTGASFNNFFQRAAGINGGGTIIDQTPASMATLANGASNTATSPLITFTTIGTSSIRVCADKSNAADLGTINEGSNEGNNCSPWTNVTVTAGPVPVVTISASPTSGTVNVVNPAITWSATNSPTLCSFSGDWENTNSGAVSGTNISQGILTTIKTYTYTLTCSNANGSSSPQSATVVVGAGAGTATINANPLTIFSGSPTTLTWSCLTSTSSVGTNFHTVGAVSGSVSITPVATTTFMVTCNPSASTDQVTVVVRRRPIIVE